MNQLVAWICFPMCRFATSSNHYTRSVRRDSTFSWHGSGQMHQTSYRAKYALRMINKAHQISQTGLSSEINHSVESRVVMPILTHLNELDFALKMIDHLLVPARVPPFKRDIIFSTGSHKPERDILPGQIVHLATGAFFQFA
jgi:hypothetical protein